MIEATETRFISIPYGKSSLDLKLQGSWHSFILEGKDIDPVSDLDAAVQQALENPTGAPRIAEAVCRTDQVVIVINDITRPVPSGILVQKIAQELEKAGVPDQQVKILLATGTHRPNNQEEIKNMLGPDLLKRFQVSNHDCRDEANLVYLGVTPGGTRVVVNRLYAEADYRILTGLIAPHHAAGFSGGRKSVIPGLAGLELLKRHHSLDGRIFNPAMGCLEGNPFHLEAVAAARIAGAEFILNVVPNSRGQVVAVVAGELEEAHMAGVRVAETMSRCRLPFLADIVITGAGGYPRDINLYQAQKAISAAEMVIRDNGTIILVAECAHGFGEGVFVDWLVEAKSPQEVIERFRREGFSPGASKAFFFARAAARCRLIVVTTNLPGDLLSQMFMEKATTLEEALTMAEKPIGCNHIVAVIPRAVQIIPEAAGECGERVCYFNDRETP
ncbi:MAG: nickel-dependent lactate racemase [Syntrophomonadaceae bacterium]|nr:nickel-dependent lactate racemase [Syntrophomonadaceae bacterium]